MQHKTNTKPTQDSRITKRSLKGMPRVIRNLPQFAQARTSVAKATAFRIRRLKRFKSMQLQDAIIHHFRYTLAPAMNIPHFALFAMTYQGRSGVWFRDKRAEQLGIDFDLPTLFLPLLNSNSTASCLWLAPVSPNFRRSHARIRIESRLAQLGHRIEYVSSVMQAELKIQSYLGNWVGLLAP